MMLKVGTSDAMEWALPVGYVFAPSDQELVEFLRDKIEGRRVEYDYYNCLQSLISECDLYGDQEPWDIWTQHYLNVNWRRGDDDHEDLYFFTKLKKLSVNGSRISRKVGSGTWSGAFSVHVNGKNKNNPTVAVKKHFTYENKERSDHGGVTWIMHEFSLLHDHYEGETKKAADQCFVICRLRKKYHAKTKKNNNNNVNNNNIFDNHLLYQYSTDLHSTKKMRLNDDNIISDGVDDFQEHSQGIIDDSLLLKNDDAFVTCGADEELLLVQEIEALLMFSEETERKDDQPSPPPTTTAAGDVHPDNGDDDPEVIAEIHNFLFSEEPDYQEVDHDGMLMHNYSANSYLENYSGELKRAKLDDASTDGTSLPTLPCIADHDDHVMELVQKIN